MLILRSRPGCLFSSGHRERVLRVGVTDQCLSCSSRRLDSLEGRGPVCVPTTILEGLGGTAEVWRRSVSRWEGRWHSGVSEATCLGVGMLLSQVGHALNCSFLQNLSLEMPSSSYTRPVSQRGLCFFRPWYFLTRLVKIGLGLERDGGEGRWTSQPQEG